MARSMPSEYSEHLQLMIAGYVLGDLDADEAMEFEQLLANDPVIAAEVTQMQSALETAYTPVEVQPPPHLRSAIMAAQATGMNAQRRPSTTVAKPVSRFPWNQTLGAAAAMVIVALGINNYQLRQALQATQAEMPSETLTYVLQTETVEDASAMVVVNPDTLEATLTVKNLPPLPAGKVYVLWTVLEQGAPFTVDAKSAILTEVLNVDAQGNVSQTITVPRVYRSEELVSKVAITVEDATAPQRHEGAPVMITSL
ncbi:anti-sigma factor [Leptolyngbya sp. FACHB-671]|uniref:anti-sigma factor n=1 Tax=Leptolyngbya sp. FACHB-671 TaxID=2692812 RepID=UPI001684CE6A|nr:anti-sigma factor [Leptolyngbya sp. FACHB-671]MBD2067903.1 anti-sigma factor [Leptolyngbya sp. FACHB-671]